jgi:hypothetical protein
MPVGRSCFSGARRFAGFEQGRNLSPDGDAVDVCSQRAAPLRGRPDLAEMCWSYCCLWVQKVRADNGFLTHDLQASALRAGMRARMSARQPSSDAARALVLSLGGSQTDMGVTLALLLTKGAIKTCLDAYAAQGGSFLMLTLSRSGWSHVVAVKLNGSAGSQTPSWSYPCAIFDPNVGQAVYSNHESLAVDLLTLIQAYGMVSSVRAHVVAYRET